MTETRLTAEGLYLVGKRGGSSVDVRMTAIGAYVVGRRRDDVISEGLDYTEIGGGLVSTQFLLANWIGRIKLESAWSTDVISGVSLAEERRSLIDRPYRTLEVTLTGMNKEETLQASMFLQRLAEQRSLFPLYMDETALVNPSAGGGPLFCNTRLRRFSAGGWAAIYYPGHANPSDVFQFVRIATVEPDRLLLVAGDEIDGAVFPPTKVYPAIAAEVTLTHRVEYLTDHHANIKFKVSEVVGHGAQEVVSIDVPGFAFVNRDDGRPIFNVQHNWKAKLKKTLNKEGKITNPGRGVVVHKTGPRPFVEYSLNMAKLTRPDVWEINEIFDYARGRLKTFWFVEPENILTILAHSQNNISIAAARLSKRDVEDFIPFVAFVQHNGEIEILPVILVTAGVGDSWVLTLGGIAGDYLDSELDRIAPAHLVRFQNDSLKENWTTLEVASMLVKLKEVIEEKDVSVDNIPEFGEIQPPDILVGRPPRFWAQMDRHAYSQVDDPQRRHPCINNLDPVFLLDDIRKSPSQDFIAYGVGGNNTTLVSGTFGGGPDTLKPVLGGRPCVDCSVGGDPFVLVNGGAPYWRNLDPQNPPDGLTIAVCYNNKEFSAGGPHTLFKATAGDSGVVSIDWTTDSLTVRDNATDPAHFIATAILTDPDLFNGFNIIRILHWQPGGFWRVTHHPEGSLGTGSTFWIPPTVGSEIEGSDYTYEFEFFDSYWGAALIWDHNLGGADINTVIAYLVDQYNMNPNSAPAIP